MTTLVCLFHFLSRVCPCDPVLFLADTRMAFIRWVGFSHQQLCDVPCSQKELPRGGVPCAMKFSGAHRGQQVQGAYCVLSEWTILVISE